MSNRVCLWCGGDLPKRRRKYCGDEHANLYFEEYIAPLWWSNARKTALRLAGHKCEECGNTEKLEVHHKEKLGKYEPYHNSSKNRQDNLQVLCRACHEDAHRELPKRLNRMTIPKEQIVMSQLIESL